MLRLPTKRRVVTALAVFWLLFCFWVAWGWMSARLMREPVSTVLREADGYQVRVYAPALAAQVQIHGPWTQAVVQGKRLLRAYAADAFVLDLSPLVHEERDDGSWLVSLVLPQRYTDATVPRPDDPQIRIVTAPERAVAVISYSGGSDARAAREQELRGMLVRDRVLVTGAARIMRYDAPWAPPFMQRGEVLIPILP